MLARYLLLSRVCPSFRPSHRSRHCTITAKHRITQTTSHYRPVNRVSRRKRSLRNSDGITPNSGPLNVGGVGKIALFDRSRSRRLERLTAENLCPLATMVGGPRPLHALVEEYVRAVINNIGRCQSSLITVTVQFPPTRLVVWKSVDDTSALHVCGTEHRLIARCAIFEPIPQRRVYKTKQ